jgi:hypothetical protein
VPVPDDSTKEKFLREDLYHALRWLFDGRNVCVGAPFHGRKRDMDTYSPDWKRLEFLLNGEARAQSLSSVFRVIPARENDSLEVKDSEGRREALPPEIVSNLLQDSTRLAHFVTDFHQLDASATHRP